MKLTFEQIRKECEPMKHLLVDERGKKRLYLGFNRGCCLVTDCDSSGGVTSWDEINIENWIIKEYKQTRKVSFWDEYDKYYLNESVCLLDELRKQHPDLEIEVES